LVFNPPRGGDHSGAAGDRYGFLIAAVALMIVRSREFSSTKFAIKSQWPLCGAASETRHLWWNRMVPGIDWTILILTVHAENGLV
jgi:Flp pilus assembly pilin Flp